MTHRPVIPGVMRVEFAVLNSKRKSLSLGSDSSSGEKREMGDLKSWDKKRVLPTWMTAQEAEKRKVAVKTPKGRRPAAQGAATARWDNFRLGLPRNQEKGGLGGITVAGAEPSGAGGAGRVDGYFSLAETSSARRCTVWGREVGPPLTGPGSAGASPQPGPQGSAPRQCSPLACTR